MVKLRLLHLLYPAKFLNCAQNVSNGVDPSYFGGFSVWRGFVVRTYPSSLTESVDFFDGIFFCVWVSCRVAGVGALWSRFSVVVTVKRTVTKHRRVGLVLIRTLLLWPLEVLRYGKYRSGGPCLDARWTVFSFAVVTVAASGSSQLLPLSSHSIAVWYVAGVSVSSGSVWQFILFFLPASCSKLTASLQRKPAFSIRTGTAFWSVLFSNSDWSWLD